MWSFGSTSARLGAGAIAVAGAATGFKFSQTQKPVHCLDYDPPTPPHYPFYFKAPFNSYDVKSMRRGYEVYRKVCATCHSMEQICFRHLVNEVLPEARMKKIAASYEVKDGPNEEGEMFDRPGLLIDAFPKPYPNEEAARYANGGALPPDLSQMSAARHHGPDYLMALLIGYRDPPEGVKLRPGLYYNTYMPGGYIGMPPPLADDLIEYEDGTPATVSQMAKDVTMFITWATDPQHDDRKIQGMKGVSAIFLALLCMGYWYRWAFITHRTRRIDFGKMVI